MLKNMFYCLFVWFSLLGISGCSITPKDTKSKPIDLKILTAKNLNLDQKLQASPLQLDLYEVDNVVVFTMVDYLSFQNIFNNGEEGETIDKSLSTSTLIQKPKYSWILQPDTVFIDEINITEDIDSLGFLAHYQDIDNSEWRSLFKKQNIKRQEGYYLYLYVDQSSIKQLSKDEMRELLKKYATTHPDDSRFTKYGRLKKQQSNYSKGIFIQNSDLYKHTTSEQEIDSININLDIRE